MNDNNYSECTMMIANRMMDLLENQDAARLQATVIAFAACGVYDPPFGKEISLDLLLDLTDLIQNSGYFPLRNLEDCASAFEAARMTAATLN